MPRLSERLFGWPLIEDGGWSLSKSWAYVITDNAEYWNARNLQSMLGYSQWSRFEQAIESALTSCRQKGNDEPNHFAGAGKMVGLVGWAVELHWYEAHGIGKRDLKIKRYLDEK